MILIREISELRRKLNELNTKNTSIGFVPTMGALHQGHFSLIEKAKKENSICVCSIFINPTQFNNSEDFEKYPSTIEQDVIQLNQLECDILFLPSALEMYAQLPKLTFHFGALEQVMEGLNRPGHFNGVAIVVSKLFHIVQPKKAYFGQKDIQQFAIISQLVLDLSFDIELECCPTLREKDGLAMSSRNLRLSTDERSKAPFIYQSLLKAKELLENNSPLDTKNIIQQDFKFNRAFQLEYLEIVDFESLQPIQKIENNAKYAICIAAFLGKVRLIDNIVI